MKGYEAPVIDEPAPADREVLIYAPNLAQRGWVKAKKTEHRQCKKQRWKVYDIQGRPYVWLNEGVEFKAWMYVWPAPAGEE